MKTTVNSILIASTLFLMSCQKEIPLQLKDSDAKVVIEGSINNTNLSEVTITKTTSFNKENNFAQVSGAEVTISDDAGNVSTLTEVAAGKYQSTTLKGEPGKTYYLTVKAEGKTYNASSTMPDPVKLDTLIGMTETFFGTKVYNVYPVFRDVAGEKNYYRFIQYINGKRLPGSVVLNDYQVDGNYNVRPLSNDLDKVNTGDIFTLEMQNMDANIYQYFNTMSQAAMGSSAPANPLTNMQGGALGYFSANTVQVRTVVVQK